MNNYLGLHLFLMKAFQFVHLILLFILLLMLI